MIKLPDAYHFDKWFKEVEAGDDAEWNEPEYGSKDWHAYLHRRQLALGAWHAYSDEIQRLNATAQPVSDGWVSVPRSLTAENGAKAALLGEFSLQQNIVCHECFGEGCDDCNGQGNWISSIPVDWTTIKEIWAKGVEHFSPAAPGGRDGQ
ncbi:hypothetical protein ACTUSR_08220 [Pantoea stewartii subsp. indologenes]|uniref:hypothetical protein n=1 Tax=Pantoea stewartii TaxID=66269 RepID=UPI003FA4455B